MRNLILQILLLIPITLFCQGRFSFFTGLTYNQQYPNGTYLKTFFVPNIEAGITYNMNKDHFFEMNPEAGLSSHNFGIKTNSGEFNKTYIRVAPYAGFNIKANFNSANKKAFIKSIWIGSRVAFFNNYCPNGFINTGVSISFFKQNLYIKWAIPLFYNFPDQELWAKPINLENYYYPLGNECWSITAGILLNISQKKKEK